MYNNFFKFLGKAFIELESLYDTFKVLYYKIPVQQNKCNANKNIILQNLCTLN